MIQSSTVNISQVSMVSIFVAIVTGSGSKCMVNNNLLKVLKITKFQPRSPFSISIEN